MKVGRLRVVSLYVSNPELTRLRESTASYVLDDTRVGDVSVHTTSSESPADVIGQDITSKGLHTQPDDIWTQRDIQWRLSYHSCQLDAAPFKNTALAPDRCPSPFHFQARETARISPNDGQEKKTMHPKNKAGVPAGIVAFLFGIAVVSPAAGAAYSGTTRGSVTGGSSPDAGTPDKPGDRNYWEFGDITAKSSGNNLDDINYSLPVHRTGFGANLAAQGVFWRNGTWTGTGLAEFYAYTTSYSNGDLYEATFNWFSVPGPSGVQILNPDPETVVLPGGGAAGAVVWIGASAGRTSLRKINYQYASNGT